MYIWLTVSSYMGKYLRISSYMTLQLLSFYMRKIWFSFYQCTCPLPSLWVVWTLRLKLYCSSCCLSLIVVGVVADGSTGYRLTRAETCSSSRRGEGKRRDPRCMAAGCFPSKQNNCNETFRLGKIAFYNVYWKWYADVCLHCISKLTVNCKNLNEI